MLDLIRGIARSIRWPARADHWCSLRFAGPSGSGRAGGALAGLALALLVAGLPMPGFAEQVIFYRNTDMVGGDLRDGRLPNRSFDECAEACHADARCVAFTSANGACYKKGARAWPRPANLVNSGFIASRGTPPPGGEGQPDFRPPVRPPVWGGPVPWVNRYDGTDFPGNDLNDLRRDTDSFEECARVCASDRRCQAFAWATRDRRCYPKSAATVPKPVSGVVAGILRGGGGMPGRPQPAPPHTRYDRTDLPGNDLNDLRRDTDTFEDCAAVCASDRRCTAFAWGTGDHRCYPKYAAAPPKPDSDVISGILRGRDPGSRPPPDWVSRYDDTDLPGNDLNDLRRETRSFEECASVCAADRRCKAFAWGTNDNRCYPKYAASAPRPNSDVISGILRR